MRIAIAAQDDRGLDGLVAHHFGRCPYYALVDVEGHSVVDVNVLANPYFNKHQRGKVPYYIQKQGAQVMVAGGMGRRAIDLFEEMNIEPYTGAAGTIHRAVELVTGGQLTQATPCREHREGEGAGSHTHVGEPDGRGEIGRLRDDVASLRQQVESASLQLDDVEDSETQQDE
jgi:predicted Fe-Mo cluster-binding NifX family protein